MWRTTKTAAGKLRCNERVSVTSASTPPAEAPTTMMSCPGIFPPGNGEAVLVAACFTKEVMEHLITTSVRFDFCDGTWHPHGVPLQLCLKKLYNGTWHPQGVPLHFCLKNVCGLTTPASFRK